MEPAPEMVRCEVTDALVPLDETVVLHGKRVSAEGKQILLERLSTGQAIDGQLEAPTSLRRFGCAFLDGLLVGAVALGLGLLVGVGVATTTSDVDARAMGVVEFIAGGIALAYYVVMHATRGQTLGKIAGKIKVVNLDGSNITMGTSLLRGVFYNGLNLVPALLVIALGNAAISDFESVGLYDLVNIVIGVYALANCITVLVTRHKRAIHDFIAGTRVIQLDL